ncbi:MAG: hypothetical protein WB587_15285, partial [Nitrososphaeraceae archaeon]
NIKSVDHFSHTAVAHKYDDLSCPHLFWPSFTSTPGIGSVSANTFESPSTDILVSSETSLFELATCDPGLEGPTPGGNTA